MTQVFTRIIFFLIRKLHHTSYTEACFYFTRVHLTVFLSEHEFGPEALPRAVTSNIVIYYRGSWAEQFWPWLTMEVGLLGNCGTLVLQFFSSSAIRNCHLWGTHFLRNFFQDSFLLESLKHHLKQYLMFSKEREGLASHLTLEGFATDVLYTKLHEMKGNIETYNQPFHSCLLVCNKRN